MEVFFVGFPRAMRRRDLHCSERIKISPANGSQKANKRLSIKYEEEVFVAGKGTRERISGIRRRWCGFVLQKGHLILQRRVESRRIN